jgi:hypothetical protein
VSGRQPVQVDRHLWRHAIDSSVAAGLGAFVLAWLTPRSVPVSLFILAAVILGLVTWLAVMAATGSVAIGAYVLAWGVLLAAWLPVARVLGVWHVWVQAGLWLPVLALAGLGAVAIGHHRDSARRSVLALDDGDAAERRRWAHVFELAGVPGIEVAAVRRNDNGQEVYGRLGRGTAGEPVTTFAELAGRAQKIATILRVSPAGVLFTQDPEQSAADFVMHVRERTGRREAVPLPAEVTVLSICSKIGLGVQDSGREFRMLFPETAITIAGMPRSGKSNALGVIISQLARCCDVVICMIDLKSGRASRPWMVPWLQDPELPGGPPIDWLATTRQEADLMLDALIAAGKARAASGTGGEKITPSAEHPAIVVICDETAVMTGHGLREDGLKNSDLSLKLLRVAETYQSEAIIPIVATLRTNVETMGSTGYKAMSQVRIALQAADSGDGRSVFPDHPHAAEAVARIRDKGDALVKIGPDITPVRFYRITEARIKKFALATARFRPQLEGFVQAAMGEPYATRWTREHGETLRREWGAAENIAPPRTAIGEADVDAAFEELTAGLDDPEKTDPRERRMLDILKGSRYQGFTVRKLMRLMEAAEDDPPARQTIHAWLRKNEQAGKLRHSGDRWIWIRTAADELPEIRPRGADDLDDLDELDGDDGYPEAG